ncbi:transcription antiterminator [Rhizobium sp. CF122]|uniref:transcription termination/antitermination protein NusG n=1 Tax=Rhizobium sp. CF122 TaxID=1144312 RepID=UPI000271A015|nr:transcription termination/antitermination NusG family protein [Rhizobium sp. CF122]EJL57954.1 transcription antiterminator [Rhizobium sp. CF122]
MIMQRKIIMAEKVDINRLMPALEGAASLRRINATMLSMASKANAERISVSENVKPHWYCLRVMTGREFAVEKLLADADVESLVVTTNAYKTVKRGRVRIVPEKPVIVGYVLVHCVSSAAAMAGLLSVKDVIEVVGGAETPWRADAESIARFKAMAAQGKYDHKVKPKVDFLPEEIVRVCDGPFASFQAVVVSVDFEGCVARVEVDIFGRKTPVELDLAQIEKI